MISQWAADGRRKNREALSPWTSAQIPARFQIRQNKEQSRSAKKETKRLASITFLVTAMHPSTSKGADSKRFVRMVRVTTGITEVDQRISSKSEVSHKITDISQFAICGLCRQFVFLSVWRESPRDELSQMLVLKATDLTPWEERQLTFLCLDNNPETQILWT